MLKKRFILSNNYFFYPNLFWLLSGLILIKEFSKKDLFLFINGNHSNVFDYIMYYSTYMGQAEVIIPVLLSLFLLKRFRNWKYFFSALLCNIIPFFLQQGFKTLFNYPRPMNFVNDIGWKIHHLPSWPLLLHRGFPSGHSAGAFSFFCFLSFLLPPKYRKLGLLFFLLAMMVCYSRVYLAAHFFEDVYVGSLLGWFITTIIYWSFDKFKLNP